MLEINQNVTKFTKSCTIEWLLVAQIINKVINQHHHLN